MSLAENLLNSLSTENISEDYSTDEEEHIVVDNTRKITVPAKLRTIAVEGDKDIETVTIDCVRYWDEHDLSSFAIYINYMLPSGETGTYIPENIIRNDDYFSFNWVIGRNLTKYSGSISFLILARQTDSFGGVIYQWSSLLNSEFNVSKGLEVTSVPEENLTQDIISQILQSLNLKLSYSNISSSTGYEDDLIMSQRATTVELSKRANALVGNVSGAVVSMDDVSPLEHKVAVKITGVSDDIDVTVKSCGKNFADIADKTISKNAAWGSDVLGEYNLPNGTYTISSYIEKNAAAIPCLGVKKKNGNYLADVIAITGGRIYGSFTVDDSCGGGIKIYAYSNYSGNVAETTCTYSKTQIEFGKVATPFEPYIEGETITTTLAEGAEVTSIAPNMTIFTDNANVTIDATYNKDINKVIEKLTQAIISIGGVV